jgi:lysine 2,3-aminomutase
MPFLKRGLLLHPTRGAFKLPTFLFPATQSSLFRSAALQQVHAGLARASEPEFIPQHILQDPPETFTHPPPHFEDLLEKGGVRKLQEISKSMVAPTSTESAIDPVIVPAYFRGSKFDRVPYWQKIGRWKDISEKQFLSYSWGVRQTQSP